jgi:hypothetical protein
MKATQMKSMITKMMTAGLLAGALLFAGPKKADAQQFSIGVQFGTPAYGYGYTAYPDYYARRSYYEHLRVEQARRAEIERQEWLRRQAWARHEQHERWAHDRGYDRDGYRGR